mmetsp:Transcript_63657/g.164284  ORF Transcript_63657/g.164284 Transcript_63657/m.164284 type:complete len:288 (+) Transcript_63657:312-1175(+)
MFGGRMHPYVLAAPSKLDARRVATLPRQKRRRTATRGRSTWLQTGGRAVLTCKGRHRPLGSRRSDAHVRRLKERPPRRGQVFVPSGGRHEQGFACRGDTCLCRGTLRAPWHHSVFDEHQGRLGEGNPGRCRSTACCSPGGPRRSRALLVQHGSEPRAVHARRLGPIVHRFSERSLRRRRVALCIEVRSRAGDARGCHAFARSSTKWTLGHCRHVAAKWRESRENEIGWLLPTHGCLAQWPLGGGQITLQGWSMQGYAGAEGRNAAFRCRAAREDCGRSIALPCAGGC